MSSNEKNNDHLLQAPRGTRDFVGDTYDRKADFYRQAEAIARGYGFTGIETPVFEHTEIFTKGVGEGTDIVDKEMYNFTTAGGDRLTLRPEGTAAVMRAYIEHGMGSMPQPLYLYYTGPFFRHEKPQKGRYRQLYQFGLEVMGGKNPMYDILTIKTGYNILKTSGREISVQVNTLGSVSERQNYLEILKKFYQEHQSQLAESDQYRIETNPLRILDSKEPSTKTINEKAPLLQDQLGEASKAYFDAVTKGLEDLGIPYEVVPSLVRGLDYYEHTVFEYVTKDEQGANSLALGGGGRYDGLAEMIGHKESVPAVGLGLGVDRILEVAHDDAYLDTSRKKVSIIAIGDKVIGEAIKIAGIVAGSGCEVLMQATD
ncbi:histidine--tRNA ligase, partial [Patescibacteria group bacterium]|nr:histidine--tRNA ligase [Patescibacteria group bacterium]